MRLKTKILSLNVTTIITLAILISGINFYFSTRQVKQISTVTKDAIMKNKKNELEHLVEITASMVKSFSTVDEPEDFKRDILLTDLEQLRFSETGYYFGFDMSESQPKWLFHGVKTERRGKDLDLSSFKDANGKLYIKEMVDVAMADGSGFVVYVHENPLTNHEDEKLGYAIYLPEQKWVIGTGFYIEDINEDVGSIQSKIKKLFHHQSLTTYTSFIIIGIILSIISIIFSGFISKPILDLKNNLNKIADGDLNVEIKITTKDEIGELGTTFNKFASNLKEIIFNIKEMSQHVEEQNLELFEIMENIVYGKDSKSFSSNKGFIERGIAQLDEQITEVLDNVRNQTASSEESLASLEEISSTSDNMAENTKEASDAFEVTSKLISSNLSDIENMSNGMQSINESVSQTNDEIEKLKILSIDIENILTSINSISEQTNLLALNAAIEAARAGEAGRGFAVVADEIRKLAEGTGQETKKIESIINQIQTEVENVKQSGEASSEKVVEGLELMKISQENTVKISDLTNQNSAQISEIRNSSHEQSLASREITDAITSITESSTEIESLSHDTSEISKEIQHILMERQQTVEELARMAKELKKDLDFFKI